jgi:hypothetical protein
MPRRLNPSPAGSPGPIAEGPAHVEGLRAPVGRDRLAAVIPRDRRPGRGALATGGPRWSCGSGEGRTRPGAAQLAESRKLMLTATTSLRTTKRTSIPRGRHELYGTSGKVVQMMPTN